MIDRPSPNFGPRADNTSIDIVLIHYTGMPTAQEALDRMCDPAAQVSAHYLIDEDGVVFRLVDEAHRAWHAGEGTWCGQGDINSRSIGIELANPGHEWGYRSFPMAQIKALITLAKAIRTRHNIPSYRVLGHSDIAPHRKQDPGELFPWATLAQSDLGLWTDFKGYISLEKDMNLESVPVLLQQIGYNTSHPLEKVITAFQRHFVQNCITGQIDIETWDCLIRVAQAAVRLYPPAMLARVAGPSLE